MPKQKRVRINQACKANLKSVNINLSGEHVLGTVLISLPRQSNRLKEKEHTVSVKDGQVKPKVTTVFDDCKIEWEHIPTNNSKEGIKVTVSDPVFVNPSTYETVAEVLRSIGKKARIKRYDFSGPDAKEWIYVTMDGSPYLLVRQIIIDTHICCERQGKDENQSSYYGKQWIDNKKKVHGDRDVLSVKEFDWVVLGRHHIWRWKWPRISFLSTGK